MKIAVIQPLPGIGDMIWHLPHIRALAAAYGVPVTLVAKPRSLADQIWADDPAIAGIMWIDINPSGRRGAHDGAGGFLRLVRDLRQQHFTHMIMLHHSHTIAAAGMLAGIAHRSGYGWGKQRWFLNTGPYLPKDVARLHQHTRATRFLDISGVPLPSAEPMLPVSSAASDSVRTRIPETSRPFIAIGIGSSEKTRQWGADNLAGLASTLLKAGWPAVALLGGPEDQPLATAIQEHLGPDAHRAFPALGWHLSETAALLAQSSFYVGNNTGVMNMAAAAGVRTYALFGTTPPFHHASQILPILSPHGGPNDGMARVTLDAVCAAIKADRGTLAPPR